MKNKAAHKKLAKANDQKNNIVSVFIKGKGRFYAWGKTRKEAQEDLVAGLLLELEYANGSVQNLLKADRALRNTIDKAISLMRY